MQPSSATSSHGDHSQRKPARPSLSSASTITPNTPTLSSERRGRQRAKTELAQQPSDRHPHPKKDAHRAPLHLDLASFAEQSSPSTPKNVPDIIIPSDPIPIPSPRPKDSTDVPRTPLSARAHTGRFMHLGVSLKPRYMEKPDNSRPVNYFSDSSDSSIGSVTKLYPDAPTSPLSPTMPISQRSPRGRDPPSVLRLPPLPRFHPAHYESPSTGVPHTPRSSHSSRHGRQYSDAKQQIHKYQRDIVTNATRAARLTNSPKAVASPLSPRLHPMGSPGPVTPFALEEKDYLSARNTGSPGSTSSNGRDLVERLVQKENERRMHPGRAESLSPAVSPAGGSR